MAISKIDTVGDFFVGQGDVIIFDEIANYATAKLSTLANPKSVGDVHLDSTNFTGDAPTITPLQNEQGQAYYTTVTEGTFGFEIFIPSTSEEMIEEFMMGEEISDTFTGDNGFASGTTAIGAMHKSTAQERPIMIVNDKKNRALVVPKAMIVASPSMQDKVSGILVSVTAQKLDTESLKTLVWTKGKIE